MFLHDISTKYKPEIALVVYKVEGTTSLGESPSHYLEAFEFHEAEGSDQYEMKNGKPLAKETLDSLADFLKKRKTREQKIFTFKSKLIPPNILFVGQKGRNKRVCWHLHRPQKTLLFADQLNIPSGKVELPSLVFTYNGDLSVYAYKTKQLTGETQLYRAPFHNTSEGSVCLGSARIKINSSYWEDLVSGAENAFFNSNFTHLHGGNPVDGNLNVIYDRCTTKGLPFPLDVLKPINKTLNDIL